MGRFTLLRDLYYGKDSRNLKNIDGKKASSYRAAVQCVAAVFLIK